MSKELEKILLEEIRLNRAAIESLRKDFSSIDKQIFSNKIKLSAFISSITILVNIIVIVIIEKIKNVFS